MDIQVYEAKVKRSYGEARAQALISKAELKLKRMIENFEEDDKICIELKEVQDLLGFALNRLEY